MNTLYMYKYVILKEAMNQCNVKNRKKRSKEIRIYNYCFRRLITIWWTKDNVQYGGNQNSWTQNIRFLRWNKIGLILINPWIYKELILILLIFRLMPSRSTATSWPSSSAPVTASAFTSSTRSSSKCVQGRPLAGWLCTLLPWWRYWLVFINRYFVLKFA